MVYSGNCGKVHFKDGHSEDITCVTFGYCGIEGFIDTESGKYYWKEIRKYVKSRLIPSGLLVTKRVEWYKYDPTVFLENAEKQTPFSRADIDRFELAEWVTRKFHAML